MERDGGEGKEQECLINVQQRVNRELSTQGERNKGEDENRDKQREVLRQGDDQI